MFFDSCRIVRTGAEMSFSCGAARVRKLWSVRVAKCARWTSQSFFVKDTATIEKLGQFLWETLSGFRYNGCSNSLVCVYRLHILLTVCDKPVTGKGIELLPYSSYCGSRSKSFQVLSGASVIDERTHPANQRNVVIRRPGEHKNIMEVDKHKLPFTAEFITTISRLNVPRTFFNPYSIC